MMKQMKHWALGVALLAGGLTMTSCLGGDSDPYNFNGFIAKVSSFYGLTSFSSPGNQITVTPEEGSVLAYETTLGGSFKFSNETGKVGVMGYYWNPEVLDIPAGETSISGVSLNYYIPLDADVLVCPAANVGTERDSVATHPIISLNPYAGMDYTPFFFDDSKQEIVAYVNYYVPQNGSGATSLSTTLVYYPDDPLTMDAQTRDTLCLHLNYRVNGAEKFTSSIQAIHYQDMASYNPAYMSTYMKSFRLNAYDNANANNILQTWRSRTGKQTFTGVKIVVKENYSSTELNNAMTKQVSYPVRTWQEAAGIENN